MKTYKPPQTPGFFDVKLYVQWLLAKGKPLSRLQRPALYQAGQPYRVPVQSALERNETTTPSTHVKPVGNIPSTTIESC